MRADRAILLSVLIAAWFSAASAFAQDNAALLRDGVFARDRTVSVEERPHPEYAPIPLRTGAFYVLPTMPVVVEANDNIYASALPHAPSDTVVRLSPGISAKSAWNKHALSLIASLDASFYSSHGGENTANHLVGLDGRLDIRHDLSLAAGARYEHDSEDRSETAAQTAVNTLIAGPVRYDVGSTYSEGGYATNRFRFTGRISAEDYRYDNARTSGGALVYQADRSHTILSEGGRIEFSLAPDTSVFGQVTLNQRRYRNAVPGEPLRNSSGYNVELGANFDLTHLVRGEVAAGYLNQDYEASIFDRSSGLGLKGKVQWFATQLTTVTVAGSRSAEDAGIPGVGGYGSTSLAGRIDHELLRNLVLAAGGSLGLAAYNRYDRSDKRAKAFLGATYLMSRAVTVRFSVSHFKQSSSGVYRGASFDVNRLYGGLSYAL